MPRRNPPAKWTLPDVVDPPTHICITVPVPNDRHHIGAFYGAMLTLASATGWQDDTAHTAKLVAQVWKEIFYNLRPGECDQLHNLGVFAEEDELNLRIKPSDPCIIQIRCGEDDWIDWYDPRGCIPGSVTQPAAGGDVPVGECREYDVALSGNQLWRLPVSVQAGDTVQISSAVGGWWDGTVSPWHCPNGQSYLLGGCVGSGGPSGGDPAPSVDHMRLIAGYGGNFFDAYNLTLTIPAGTPPSDIDFQANDSALDDNKGSVSFHVKYCRSAVALWCATWNATNGWASWISDVTFGCQATLTAGVWHSCHNTFPFEGMALHIDGLVLPAGSVITEIVAVADTTDTNPASNVLQSVDDQGGNFQKNFAGTGTPQTMTFNTVHASGTVNLYATVNGPSGSPTSLYSYQVFGTGPTPTWAAGLECA
jgi:hypothetical protein